MALPDPVAILISILFMATTIIVSAGVLLRIRPLPYGRALLIAAVSNLLGKLLVSILHWPGAVSYSLPTDRIPGTLARLLQAQCAEAPPLLDRGLCPVPGDSPAHHNTVRLDVHVPFLGAKIA